MDVALCFWQIQLIVYLLLFSRPAIDDCDWTFLRPSRAQYVRWTFLYGMRVDYPPNRERTVFVDNMMIVIYVLFFGSTSPSATNNPAPNVCVLVSTKNSFQSSHRSQLCSKTPQIQNWLSTSLSTKIQNRNVHICCNYAFLSWNHSLKIVAVYMDNISSWCDQTCV